jgi:transcriptional repressor NrdR
MYCPKCLNLHTDVSDSRVINDGKTVRRRRVCPKCGYRFSTLESVKILDLKVEKRNGRMVMFDEEKLERGVRKAFNKRNIDPVKIEKIVQAVQEEILKLDKKIIKSTRIGRIVLRVLKKYDEAAYICFWSMFGDFETAEDFNELLKEIKEDDTDN